jgi:anaerobic selenocysteine-containing dehydrogenase
MRAASRSRSKRRVVNIDGSRRNPVTEGFICAKVRRFGERLYGPDRLLHPAIRKGRKGEGRFKRVSWDEALEFVAEAFHKSKSAAGGESILPFSYGGSNGLLTQDNLDALLWRRFGTSRLARTVCAAPTGAANMALYGKMPSVTYQDYPEASLIILWGVNPSASGIHLIPYVRDAQKRGARLWSSTRERRRSRARRTCTSRSSLEPTWRSRSPSIVICSRTDTPTRRFSTVTRTAPIGFASVRNSGRSSVPRRLPASMRVPWRWCTAVR